MSLSEIPIACLMKVMGECMAYQLTFQDGESTIHTNGIAPLSEALRGNGYFLAMPCSGRGICGKCLVWISGPVSPIDGAEQTLLNRLPPSQPPDPSYSLRLACLCRAEGDCRIFLPKSDAVILSQGEGILPSYDGIEQDALGFAVDVGTTTLALALYDLRAGKQLAIRTAMNEQSAFGADVLSRIAYGDAHGIDNLHGTVIRQLNGLMAEALRGASVLSGRISRVVITGNTTMLHLLMGYDPHGIGISPFTPKSLFGGEFSAHALFPMLPDCAQLYLPPCASAYIGADVVCGMIAVGMDHPGGNRLLIDVGTNGEMALISNGEILCCATAAGPAFEGARIAMGMTAASGAIYGVYPAKNGLSIATIGGAPARGISGTGLISAVGTLRKLGIIQETGALQQEGHSFGSLMTVHEQAPAIRLGDTPVLLTAKDVREVQLAKAAIAAGIDTLLAEAGLTPKDVDQAFLAGGFGNAIHLVEAADIGLIPRSLVSKATAAGNAALFGAAMMLLSIEQRKAAAQMATHAREILLATNSRFMDAFIEHMMFPEE